MELNEYQATSRRTIRNEQAYRDQVLNATLGLTGETGEFADAIKKILFHDHMFDYEALAKELGDILFYLAWAAELMGYKLNDIAQMNIDKLKERYPDGFDPERSKANTGS